jgi:F-type H+-transporting ATPase subunit alpha
MSKSISDDEVGDGSSLGKVVTLKDGILSVIGIDGVKSGEILYIESSFENLVLKALVLNINSTNVDAILLGNERLVSEGCVVYRSDELLRLNAGLRLFGRVSNSLGVSKDDVADNDLILVERSGLIEKKATGIIDRVSVSIPLRTGIKAIDSLVPIGRGQRELIIGDKQTGKTSVAIDAILNHVLTNGDIVKLSTKLSVSNLREITWFVYASIGQKQSTVSEIRRKLSETSSLWYTSMISATAAEPAPMQFLAPYTACAVGEYVRDVIGGHCIVIYDDLSKHAVAYRQMSLLLRRPPGREAFPGDVFYVHSRLLERAGSLKNKWLDSHNVEQVRGTLTALPIIETQAGDVSAYIPTNVISITDGQIFLESELFYKGIRPAINVGLSVSRVGSAAQPSLMKKVSGSLKMELAQFREIEGFAKLGANLDDHTKRLLIRGENIIEMLKQDVYSPITMFEQTLSIFVGLGYSVAWLGDIIKISNIYEDQLLNYTRVRLSWLEWLRLKSNDFTINSVRQFLAELLRFSNKIGLKNIMNNSLVENLMTKFINNCPFGFFDDILNIYFFDFGSLQETEVITDVSEFTMFDNSVGGNTITGAVVVDIFDNPNDLMGIFYNYVFNQIFNHNNLLAGVVKSLLFNVTTSSSVDIDDDILTNVSGFFVLNQQKLFNGFCLVINELELG